MYASKSKIITLDPHLGYDWLSYSLLNSVCGVLSVSDSSSNVNRVASSMRILDAGKKVVFDIKEDVLFHHGRLVTASDVVYSFNRMLDPNLDSPGAGFFHMIEGFEDYRAKKSRSMSGIRATGKYRVEFTLSRPSEAFLHALKTNFGCIIPKEVVDRKQFHRLPVSTGKLKIKEWLPNGDLITVLWKKKSKNNSVRYISGLNRDLAQAKLALGEIDHFIDDLQGAKDFVGKFNINNETNTESYNTTFLAMNTKLKPFNDVKVRRAFNYAINKDKIISLLSGSVAKATQILPPSIPGHRLDYDIYKYSQQKARDLLKQSGFDRNSVIELYSVDAGLYRKVLSLIVKDLRAVGVNVNLKFGTHQQVLNVAANPNKGQIVFSDGLAWVADYIDASNFYFPILSRSSLLKNEWNWSQYSNSDLDEMALQADSLMGEGLELNRIKRWQDTFHQVMLDAPWVPLYHRHRAASPNQDGRPAYDLFFLFNVYEK